MIFQQWLKNDHFWEKSLCYFLCTLVKIICCSSRLCLHFFRNIFVWHLPKIGCLSNWGTWKKVTHWIKVNVFGTSHHDTLGKMHVLGKHHALRKNTRWSKVNAFAKSHAFGNFTHQKISRIGEKPRIGKMSHTEQKSRI